MKYRKLRFAWSVVWGIVCLLLIVLWVRSYWLLDIIDTPFAEIHSAGGKALAFQQFDANRPWAIESHQIEHPVGYRRNYETNAASAKAASNYVLLIAHPYWLSMLILATAVVLPWLRWRFSLRTLLIGMTLVAVVLGIAVALM